MRLAVATLALACLAGCASVASQTASFEEREVPKDSHPSYKVGFHEGCYSAVSRFWQGFATDVAYKRDEARMRSDQEYQIGWNDGAMKCNLSGAASPMIIMPIKR